MKSTDVSISECEAYFLPVKTRVPLKFGIETLTEVTCLRVCVQVVDREGRTATGWGETPLSVQWVWPSSIAYQVRFEAILSFIERVMEAWAEFNEWGHPIEIGYSFQQSELPRLLTEFNSTQLPELQLPYLAALLCCSAFDIALHDAYGILHGVPTYDTYHPEWMNAELADFVEPAEDSDVSFRGIFPNCFLRTRQLSDLSVWHLVGALDALDASDRGNAEPEDGYPYRLTDWIDRDGLKCLKIKLRGNDSAWDYDRLVRVGQIAVDKNVHSLSADFNCTVNDPAYVNEVIDRLKGEHVAIYDRILYIEQPFPYNLEEHMLDVRSVSDRKPLFMDESAHDWKQIRLGLSLGWNGVALKTCKTQTGAILSLCWAQAHDMPVMVQDLTNPMLAQIPHVLLAAHAHTIMGVESNCMQFYPEASLIEARIHPGLYSRRNGKLDLSSVTGPGFGYQIERHNRPLPKPLDAIQSLPTNINETLSFRQPGNLSTLNRRLT